MKIAPSPVVNLSVAPRSILVVDDEVLIRFAVADFLRDCGYQVIEASDAAEAVTLLESDALLIDLVFSDVQMPGTMDGFGLAKWVRANRPGVSVILTSGVARTADLGDELCGIGPVEPKPYHGPTLSKRIRLVLGE